MVRYPIDMAKHNITLGFQRNGRTHTALLIARSLKKRFTLQDLQAVSTIFTNTKRASQSLCLLVKKGFLDKTDAGWRITEKGVKHLYLTAYANPQAMMGD